MRLREAPGGRSFPAQITRAPKGLYLHFLLPDLAAHTAMTLRAQASGKEEVTENRVALTDRPKEGRLDITVGGKPFTSYHYGSNLVRPFLFPVLGPGRRSVTRSWPMDPSVPGEVQDQPHQKSLWVGYGDCNGVDNWTDLPGHGSQRHRGFAARVSGSVFGRLSARIAWCTPRGATQFDETRDVTVYATAGGLRLMDVTVTLAMTRAAVTFRDTKEGGLLAVRVASSMDGRRGGVIETSEGAIGQAEAWGRPAAWCDYSGDVGGRREGIAVMDHGGNPRFPTGWHVREYGLMAANCFAWSHYRPGGPNGDMTFRKGSKTTWRYRVCIHRGGAREGRVAEAYCNFAFPPRVAVDG